MYQDSLSNYATIIIFFPTTATLIAVTRSVNFANSVRMRENMDLKNSEHGHFSRSDFFI